jgi:hypothetical protein
MRSWTIANMFPKSAGEVVGSRDLNSGMEMLTLDIEFSGLGQHNLGNNYFAQQVLDAINISNANPYIRNSFIDGLQAEVEKFRTGHDHSVEVVENLNVETRDNPKWTTNQFSDDVADSFPDLVTKKTGKISER